MSRKSKQSQVKVKVQRHLEPSTVQVVTRSAKELVHNSNRTSEYLDTVNAAARVVLESLEAEVENSVRESRAKRRNQTSIFVR